MADPIEFPAAATSWRPRRDRVSLFARIVCVLMLTLGLSPATQGRALAGPPGLIQFNIGGNLQTGLELINLGREAIIIGRDGSLHSIDPGDKQQYVGPADGSYAPMSAAEMRNQLRREFGPAYEVVATQHFLIVQPKNRGDKWPELFEQSHRTFIRYMNRRGVRIREGRFPMVAVVFPDSREMYREFAKLKLDVSRVAGIYANNTNRVMAHDGGHQGLAVATVRHEAAHQSGFNSGVHSRVNDTPRWVTEGIGQLFEPAAMGDVRQGASVRDRVNRDSLTQLTKTYGTMQTVSFGRDLHRLVVEDRLFDGEPSISDAYAIAWSMMFYLAEREPRRFAAILNHTAARPAFKTYERDERLSDFQRIMGCDVERFARKVSAYMRHLQP